MNSSFKNKIVAFYPVKDDHSLDPVVYYTVISGHKKSSLLLNVILGGLDLNNNSFKLHLEIQRDDDKVMFNHNYNINSDDIYQGGLIKSENITVGTYYLGPIKFDVSQNLHSYNATLTLFGDDKTKLDMAHTWFLSKGDK